MTRSRQYCGEETYRGVIVLQDSFGDVRTVYLGPYSTVAAARGQITKYWLRPNEVVVMSGVQVALDWDWIDE